MYEYELDIPRIGFIGQGFQKLEYYRQTDRHTDSTEYIATQHSGLAMLLNNLVNVRRRRYKTVRTQGAMNATFSRRYGVIAIALSWSLAFLWAIPPAVSPSTAAIDGATQACSVNWRHGDGFAYPAAYLLVGQVMPLTVEVAVYYGVYLGVMRASRRLHQRAIVSGRGSIVNLAMRVSQSSSRWSVVSCQSRSSTSTTSSGVL